MALPLTCLQAPRSYFSQQSPDLTSLCFQFLYWAGWKKQAKWPPYLSFLLANCPPPVCKHKTNGSRHHKSGSWHAADQKSSTHQSQTPTLSVIEDTCLRDLLSTVWQGRKDKPASLVRTPCMLKVQCLLLCRLSDSCISHQILFRIGSQVTPQAGCRKRRKAERCCFVGVRVLGATGATRLKYHRCFSAWVKMVKLQGETEPHYGLSWNQRWCYVPFLKLQLRSA